MAEETTEPTIEGRPWPPPDPAATDPDRPGMRAHRHPERLLNGWVFIQSELWVDRYGNEHEIPLMDLDYVANVISYCRRRADDIRSILYGEAIRQAVEQLLDGDHFDAADTIKAAGVLVEADPLAVVEATALMVALRGRLGAERKGTAAGDSPGREGDEAD